MTKTLKNWYWESYGIVSYDNRSVTHAEFMHLVILGKLPKSY